jgi:hypothetical protein
VLLVETLTVQPRNASAELYVFDVAVSETSTPYNIGPVGPPPLYVTFVEQVLTFEDVDVLFGNRIPVKGPVLLADDSVSVRSSIRVC